MLKIERFVNELMTSNCYIVADEASKHCICIDPASEKSLREIEFIESNGLTLDYIILTHEHTDHNWGVNALLAVFPGAKVVCSNYCKNALSREAKVYFQLYYDVPNYVYHVERVDITAEEISMRLNWQQYEIVFIATPGHSPGAICIEVDKMLFGGDTLMPFKPYIKKRNGGSIDEYRNSLLMLKKKYSPQTIVYPGHGERMPMSDMLVFFDNILNSNNDNTDF